MVDSVRSVRHHDDVGASKERSHSEAWERSTTSSSTKEHVTSTGLHRPWPGISRAGLARPDGVFPENQNSPWFSVFCVNASKTIDLNKIIKKDDTLQSPLFRESGIYSAYQEKVFLTD